MRAWLTHASVVLRVYILRVLVAFDQLINAVFGGYPDETISARWYRLQNKVALAYWGCKLLWLIETDHCYKAYLSTINQKYVQPTERTVNE